MTPLVRIAARPLSAFSLFLLLGPSSWAAEPFDTALYADLLSRFTLRVSDVAGTRVDYRGVSKSAD